MLHLFIESALIARSMTVDPGSYKISPFSADLKSTRKLNEIDITKFPNTSKENQKFQRSNIFCIPTFSVFHVCFLNVTSACIFIFPFLHDISLHQHKHYFSLMTSWMMKVCHTDFLSLCH